MKSRIPQYYGSTIRSEEYANLLRKNETKAEYFFWQMVRNRRLLGLKIRRQHPIGPFIADFYCHELKLVIEIDGDIHLLDEVKQKDLRREEFMKDLGLTTIRFLNADVLKNPHIIEQRMKELMGKR